MKKSKIYIWVGIALIALACILDGALSSRLNDGKTAPDWPMEMWILAAVVTVLLVAGIVLIVYGARVSKKEKQLQGNANFGKNNVAFEKAPQAGQAQAYVCKSCGSSMTADSLFCDRCGAKVVVEVKKQFCKSCGNELAENAQFCNKCGTKATADQE